MPSVLGCGWACGGFFVQDGDGTELACLSKGDGGCCQEAPPDHRVKWNAPDAAGGRKKPPGAGASFSESLLGLRLRVSLPPRLQAKTWGAHPEMFFLSGSDPFKISVLWSPAGRLLLLTRVLRSEAHSQRTHGLSRPFPASSPVPCLWHRHSGGPSGRQRGHLGGVTGQVPAWGLRRLGGCWRTRGAGCAAQGAPGSASGARLWGLGAPRLQHHGQVTPSRRAAGPAASPRASRSSTQRCLLPGVSTRPPLDPALPRRFRLTSSGTRELREPAAQVQRKCRRHQGKPWSRPLQTIRPFLQPPEPLALWHPVCSAQLGSAALRLHHFLLSPPQRRDAGSLGSVQRIPSRPPSPTIRLLARGGRRDEWGEGGGGRLGCSASPRRLLL